MSTYVNKSTSTSCSMPSYNCYKYIREINHHGVTEECLNPKHPHSRCRLGVISCSSSLGVKHSESCRTRAAAELWPLVFLQGGKCSPDTDNIQYLPCEMQKSTTTSARCFITSYQILTLLSFRYTHLLHGRPFPWNQICWWKWGGRGMLTIVYVVFQAESAFQAQSQGAEDNRYRGKCSSAQCSLLGC